MQAQLFFLKKKLSGRCQKSARRVPEQCHKNASSSPDERGWQEHARAHAQAELAHARQAQPSMALTSRTGQRTSLNLKPSPSLRSNPRGCSRGRQHETRAPEAEPGAASRRQSRRPNPSPAPSPRPGRSRRNSKPHPAEVNESRSTDCGAPPASVDPERTKPSKTQ